jgi:hypothetical protein
MRSLATALLLIVLAAIGARAGDGVEVREDFNGPDLPATCRVSPPAWRPAEGALRGKGGGGLDLVQQVGDDFDMTFEGSLSDKGNFEVHLVDPATGAVRIVCAFLGSYHPVLKGVKACILVDNYFVSVMPEMWIWPGRRFEFRVKRTGAEIAMFLDGAAGPVIGNAPRMGSSTVRIAVYASTPATEVTLDSLRLTGSKPSAGAAAPAPAAPPPVPQDPAAAPVLGTAKSKNITVINHANATFVCETIAEGLQRQYDWLKEWMGAAPEQVVVHVGNDYPCGFSRPTAGPPEMFLQAGSVFDSQANYAHEMFHCFSFRYGALPHWFGESMADMAYGDSEIALWKRRTEAFLADFDRADNRSYELGRLRRRLGAAWFPKVWRLFEKDPEKCRATFRDGVALETKNEMLLSFLSDAAGKDLRPVFRDELGFDVKTRERQRGY